MKMIKEILYYFISFFSRLTNTVLFGGTMHQTLSARTYTESFHSEKWNRLRIWINRLFFWQPNHCKKAWYSEVRRAIETIERNEGIAEFNHKVSVDAFVRDRGN